MTEHPSLELLKKPTNGLPTGINELDKLEARLKQLTEQVQVAKQNQIEQILTLLQDHIKETSRNLEEEHEVLTKLKARLE